MDLISIVVPIYKVEDYLKKCIDSLLNQTYGKMEIILVDDGSPDSCPKICDEYKEKDSRITVIHQKNAGLSGARNTGIHKANGKYIMFVDSDDSLEKTCVEDLYNLIKKTNTSISICGRFYEFEDGSKKCKCNETVEKVYDLESAMEEMNKFYYFDMSAWGKLYETNLFENIEFPVGKLSEDYFIMYKLFTKADKVSYTSKPLYNYLQRQSSISKNKKVNTQFIDAAYEQMKDMENYSDYMKTIVHTAYASSFLTVADTYIKQGVKPPKEFLKKSKDAIKEEYEYIKKYKNISKSKKMQFKLFMMNYSLYKICFKLYRMLKKV